MAKKPITPRKAPEPPRPRTPWPLFLGAAALVLVVAGVLALSGPGSQIAAPAETPAGPATAQLTVNQARIDFGDVPVEKVVTATFALKNTGGEDLRILNQPQVRVVEGC